MNKTELIIQEFLLTDKIIAYTKSRGCGLLYVYLSDKNMITYNQLSSLYNDAEELLDDLNILIDKDLIRVKAIHLNGIEYECNNQLADALCGNY